MAENCFYYDGSLCIACRSCQVACKQWNYLPGEKTSFFAAAGGYQNPSDLSPTTWTIIKFHEIDDKQDVEWLFRRHHCFHCSEAACIEACPVEPVKAMTRHPEFGTVYVNQELCIGCGACEAACPYEVPHVNYDIEKARKCTGCYDRVANDMLPACAKTCPTQAIRYGERETMVAMAKARVKELQKAGWKDADVYGLKQLGGLHSIYILLGDPTEIYGLDKSPEMGNLEEAQRHGREKFAAWQRGRGRDTLASVGAGGPAAMAALVGAAAAGLKKLGDRKRELAEGEKSEES